MAEFGIGGQLPSFTKLDSIQDIQKPSKGIETGKVESGASFLETLKSSIAEVNDMQVMADKAAQDFASGSNVSMHEVMIAMEKADLSLRTLASVRNKVVEAYQEIMKMQI